MKLSIIIPAYNVEQYIGKCLDSVYKYPSSERDFEVIVIDDGSSDNTLTIANDIKYAHTNLKVIHKENEGVCTARNLGLEEAKGEYVMFVDADDWIMGGVKQLIESIDRHKGAEVIAFRCYLDDGTTEFGKWNFPTYKVYKGTDLFLSHSFVRGSVWGAFYSLKFLNKYSIRFPLGITHGEDTFFSTLVGMYAENYQFEDKHIYTVYARQGSACRTHDMKRVYRYKNNLITINEYLNDHPNLTEEQKSMMRNLLFNVLSSSIIMYMFVGGRNPWYLIGIKQYLPISINGVSNMITKNKIRLMNFSYVLYFVLYQVYFKFKKII